MNQKHLLVTLLVLLTVTLTVVIVDAQGPRPGGGRSPAAPTGTGFTYQGQLKQNGALVNGTCAFNFGLWDDPATGPQYGSTQTVGSLAVTNGLFTTPIDFGGVSLTNYFTGTARYLQVAVNCGGGMTSLSPRQALTPAPYALALPGLYTQQNITSPNVIGGYSGNVITPTLFGATIGGGGQSGFPNRAWSDYATVGGGHANTASGFAATVGGGHANTASGFAATVGGGESNTASNAYATIGGGESNTASHFAATIGGGDLNTASGDSATIGGGNSNTASGQYAMVTGGYSNTAQADFSFAAGRKAWARYAGSFVWNDSVDAGAPFADSQANEFNVRSSGGVRFFTSDNYSTSCVIAAGGSSWSCTSDRAAKANFAATDGRDILTRLVGIPIQTWNYKTQDPSIRHIGPMAQDFYGAFNVGEDDKHISTIDADGVAFAAIQGLYQVVQEREEQVTSLRSQVAELQKQNAALETRLTALEHSPLSKGGEGGIALAFVTGALGVVAIKRVRKEAK